MARTMPPPAPMLKSETPAPIAPPALELPAPKPHRAKTHAEALHAELEVGRAVLANLDARREAEHDVGRAVAAAHAARLASK